MAKSLRGNCLIAAKHLRDPNFYKTVVLLIEHGQHGAMGLVINRPSSILVCNALAGHFSELPNFDDLVFVGGPVEPSALLILHNASELSGGDKPVIPEVYIGNSEHAFEEVVQRAARQDTGLAFRVFSGCAGWAPGQLEGEIARGDWYSVAGSRDLIYHEDPYELYEMTLQRVANAHRVVPDDCPHPNWN
jgi:putative transcriptional regulator